MKKVILNTLFVIYILIAVFVTVCLLSYNEYKVSEFGDYSFVLVSDEKLSPDYNKGDLVIVNKKDEIKNDEKAFFYNTYQKEIEVSLGKIIGQEPVTSNEITYTLEGGKQLSSEYVIGPSDGATRIAGLGLVLSILESKWGFLILIVLPSLLAFIYQIGVVISELKGNKKEEKSLDEK